MTSSPAPELFEGPNPEIAGGPVPELVEGPDLFGVEKSAAFSCIVLFLAEMVI